MVFRRLTADTIIILSITVTQLFNCKKYCNFTWCGNFYTSKSKKLRYFLPRVIQQTRTLVGYYAIETNALFIFFLHTFRC